MFVFMMFLGVVFNFIGVGEMIVNVVILVIGDFGVMIIMVLLWIFIWVLI